MPTILIRMSLHNASDQISKWHLTFVDTKSNICEIYTIDSRIIRRGNLLQ